MELCYFEPPSLSDEPSINDVLCKDVLLLILSHLTFRDHCRIRRVCHLWNDLILERFVKHRKSATVCFMTYTTNRYYKKKEIVESYCLRNNQQLVPLLEYHERLKELKVLNGMLGNWFLSVLAQLTNLHSMTLVECTLTIETRTLLDQLHNLTKLELIDMKVVDDDIELIAGLTQLVHLNLSSSSMFTGRHIGNLSTTLKVLNLQYCPSLNVEHLCNSINELVHKGANIEILDLKYVEFKEFSRVSQLNHISSLKVLKLSNSNIHVTLESAKEINLEKLVLFETKTHQSLVSDQTIQQWFSNQFVKLKHLNLTSRQFRLNDLSFEQCLNSCPNLEVLKLAWLANLTSKSLTLISSLSNLTRLELENINVNNQVLLDIIKNCSRLNKLVVRFLDFSLSSPSHLTMLFLRHCIEFFEQHPQRKLSLHICRSTLPSHKNFTYIPENLKLDIVKSVNVDEQM